jgi:hypothetical protein
VAPTSPKHRTSALFWNEIGALSFFLYLFFLGALYNRLRRAEGGTGWLSLLAFAGGLGFVAVHAVETLTAIVVPPPSGPAFSQRSWSAPTPGQQAQTATTTRVTGRLDH